MAMTMVEPPKAPSPAAKDLGIGGAHAVELGRFDPVAGHQAAAFEIVAGGRTGRPRRSPCRRNVVLGTGDIDRAAAAVGVGAPGSVSTQRRVKAPPLPCGRFLDRDLAGVVDELDTLLDRAFELDLAAPESPRARAGIITFTVLQPGRRRAARQASMATSPPPITATVSGISGRAPSLTRRRNSTPSTTRGRPRRARPWLAPPGAEWSAAPRRGAP